MREVELRLPVSTSPDLCDDLIMAAKVYSPRVLPTGLIDVLVCWPGGSYSKDYWNFLPEQHYSFAEHMTALGKVVVAVDPLGVRDSTRPEDGHALTLELMSSAAADFNRNLKNDLETGNVGELGPVPELRLIGVGHSMGGCLCTVEQALYESYDSIVVLGYSHRDRNLEAGDLSHLEIMKLIFGKSHAAPYVDIVRSGMRDFYYFGDVPADVIEAEDRAVEQWPRQPLFQNLDSELMIGYSTRVTCPVFIGLGEIDLTLSPHREVICYTSARDVTLFVLPRSGHIHNVASTRADLWDRIAQWLAATPAFV